MAEDSPYTYRFHKIVSVAVIDYADLVTSLTGGGISTYLLGVLSNYVTDDVYSVVAADTGTLIVGAAVRPVVVLDLVSFQANYAINEIPSAVGVVENGRNAMNPELPMSAAAIIKRYLTTRVKVQVYALHDLLDSAGLETLQGSDSVLAAELAIFGDPPEGKILFDGYITSQSTRTNVQSSDLIFEFSHFLSDLANSSSLTGDIAASSLQGLSFTPGLAPYSLGVLPSNLSAGLVYTAYGASQIALGGGAVASGDFWGFRFPRLDAGSLDYFGLKGFMEAICNQNLFNWTLVKQFRADTGVSCTTDPPADRLKNTAALSALARIEPFNVTTSPAQTRANWSSLSAVFNSLTLGPETALTREDIEALAPGRLASVGYRYGLPVFLRPNAAVNIALSPNNGFASDLMYEKEVTLGPTTLWDKLVGQWLPRYGMFIAPMSTRAIVSSFCPALTTPWTTISASEYWAIDPKFETPVEIRGAILVSPLVDWSGVLGSGGTTAQAIPPDFLHSVFDTCKKGQWVIRKAPSWLTNLSNPNAAGAGRTFTGLRPNIGDPALSQQAGSSALTQIGGVGGGAVAGAIVAALDARQKTLGYNIAKAVYQQEKLRPRTLSLSGSFRLDIGPGSVVAIEVPEDIFIRSGMATALGMDGEKVDMPTDYVTGMVTRVTLAMDAKSAAFSTSFEVSFAKMSGEIANQQNQLSTNAHPYWTAVVRGIPLVDSFGFREVLNGRNSIT